MSEKDMKIYHVETQGDYDDLMIKLEQEGYRWIGGDKPTAKNCWFECEEETVICLNEYIDFEMYFNLLKYAKREYPDINIIKHKAKGVKQMEKVVVPKFVADYIEDNYQGLEPDSFDKADLIKNWEFYIDNNFKNAKKWLDKDDNFLTFVMAIATNNYEVEEKKYYWKRKSEHSLDCEVSYMAFLNYDISEKKVCFNTNVETGCLKTKLTEKEVLTLFGKQNFNKLEKVEITE